VIIWETIRFVVVDFTLSVLYFPVWWYTAGVMKVLRLIRREVSSLGQSLNLKVLAQFLFKPMFGQRDIAGRIISFFVRIFHFLFLLIFTIVVTLLLLLLLVVWLLLPPFLLYNVLYHLGVPVPYVA